MPLSKGRTACVNMVVESKLGDPLSEYMHRDSSIDSSARYILLLESILPATSSSSAVTSSATTASANTSPLPLTDQKGNFRSISERLEI
jgi:hypothetical protein